LQKDRGLQNFLLPTWNDLPMPDLSEMVMRWLSDWPEDKVESTLSKQRQKARQKQRDAKLNSVASQHLETYDGHASADVSATADNVKDNGSKPSASKRKNRKKKKKK